MLKFKKGDKIRCLNSKGWRGLSVGDILNVIHVGVASYFTDHPESNIISRIYNDDFELVVDSPRNLQEAVHLLVEVCHGAAVKGGWWNNIETGEKLERNVGEMLCLIHSEISEAMEGHRKNLMDDKLSHRKMIEVELADAVIRIADICGGLGLDLGGAIVEKVQYNAQREDHKIENRIKENGKKY